MQIYADLDPQDYKTGYRDYTFKQVTFVNLFSSTYPVSQLADLSVG